MLKKDTVKVVVYGSLKSGFGNHPHHLGDARRLKDCETLPQYSLFSLGRYPGVIKGGKTAIQLEMYEVNAEELLGLDRLEGHPRYYKREVIPTSGGDAWIYLLPEEKYKDYTIIEDGDWKKTG